MIKSIILNLFDCYDFSILSLAYPFLFVGYYVIFAMTAIMA